MDTNKGYVPTSFKIKAFPNCAVTNVSENGDDSARAGFTS